MSVPLAELGPIFGHHAHLAAVVFEIEGKWSTDETDGSAAAHFARYSRYHGWHAELWADLLPDSVGLAELSVVGSPDDIWTEQLARIAAVGDTAGRLAVLYRSVLPRLLAATRCLVGELSSVGDAPAIRAGGFVIADLADEQSDGEALLQRRATGAALATALGIAVGVDVALSESEFGRCGA